MFLTSERMREQLRKMLGPATNAKLAVAYWGEGAVRNLKLDKFRKRDLQVVCNLLSGGTNPQEIEELQRVAQVRHCTNLHAKVYLTDNAAIVSSSNASTNGLGSEGVEVRQLIEAGIFTRSQNSLTDINAWFQKLWHEAKIIDEIALATARRRWEVTRQNRPVTRRKEKSQAVALFGHSLIELRDRSIFVTIYNSHLSDEGKIARGRYLKDARGSLKGWDCYEVEGNKWGRCLPADSYLIECYIEPKDQKVTVYSEFFYVPKNRSAVVINVKRRKIKLVWGQTAKEIPLAHFDKLVMNTDDKRKIAEAVRSRFAKQTRGEMWETLSVTSLFS